VRHELEQALAQPGTSAGQRATVTSYLGAVLALQGDPEAGRELLTEARGAFHDLGREVAELRVALVSAPVELLAGTPDRAVSELTRAVEGLQAMGDRALASTLAALLAEARWRCDDQAGAAAAADLSRRLAGVGDVISQVRWRGVLAKLEAVHRNNEQAQLLSSKAVQLVVETHEVVTQGDVLVDAAEVQLLLGNRGAAEVLLKDALDRYDRKQTPQAAAVARVRLGL
jgi:ATP/maltotriose-dependent transcriptional regulator MalT